ncbi:DUF4373 domain-containing protein [Empedobacter sp.]|uniref:DUF4373 domain-containing protein n=1 Tax=Empedobacter sp. TaxID=1927715 RepID=UPI0028AF1F0F|nr:DUF4373 domain-containing protein [Empedobacter sp.]
MAKTRQGKKGLEFFPFDVNFYNDIKIKKLIKNQGARSVSIYIYLLSAIYENGYFLKWDKDLPFFISETINCKENYIIDVVNYCITIELFNKELFKQNSILTSLSIQNRYTDICINAKRKSRVKEFSLLLKNEIEDENLSNSGILSLNSEDKTLNSEFNAKIPNLDNKVKESKVNNTSSDEEVKKPTNTREENFEEENSEIQNSTFKNFQEEKEKSSAKKEKELESVKNFLVENGADYADVSEWFRKRIDERKATTRYYAEKFILECKKNNISVKEGVFACAFNGWVNFNPQWVINQKESKSKSSKNGSKESKSDDIIVGRVNVTKTESYLESRRRQREMESARTFETDI